MPTIQIEDHVDDIIHDGIAAHAQAHGIAPMTEVAAFIRDADGTIRGGAYGDLGWNWLYVDLLWVDPALRGAGHGERALTAVEQAAYQRKITAVYLATTSFQALPFYYHLGYRLFGVLEDRPPGHRYYYLHRGITVQTRDDLPPVTVNPAKEDVRAVGRGLSAYNRSRGAASGIQHLTITLRDDNGRVVGGAAGATYWGWFDLHALWVDAAWRGHGYGSTLLANTEAEALRRGTLQVVMDVATFQALDFFTRRGYCTFATLPDRPTGHTTHFLRKAL